MKRIPSLALASICFLSGYLSCFFYDKYPDKKSQTAVLASSYQPDNDSDTARKGAVQKPKLRPLVDSPSVDDIHQIARVDVNSTFEIDSVDRVLTKLDELRAEPGNGHLVAQQFDLLKHALLENPKHADDLIAVLYRDSVNSNAFSTALSVLRALPPKDLDFALLSIAQHYEGAIDDPSSREKFITLLSNTTGVIESPSTIRALVNIVELEGADSSTKLEALNLLQPHQLYETEKYSLRSEINNALIHGNGEETARLLPQLIRFSDRQQRSVVTIDLLNQDRPTSIRRAVLEAISSSEILATDNIKNSLLLISANPSDALQGDAHAILRYTFELNPQEVSHLNAYPVR